MKRKSKKWSLALGALAMTCSFGVAMSLTSFTPASAAMPRAVATYSSEDAKTSATLSSFKVDGFGALSDFTDWFDVSYDMFLAEKSLDDYVTYNESSQSVTISNTSGSYLDMRFHLDGPHNASAGYHGKTSLGNFEVKMTIKGLNVSLNENLYMGSRLLWDSYTSDKSELMVSLTGAATGKHTLGSGSGSYVDGMGGTGAAFENLDTSTPTTITVGYVNNYAYFYYGDHLVNGYNVIKTTDAKSNDTGYRDGNQIFAMYLTGSSSYSTEIELLNFSYERLDSEFDLNAEDSVSQEVIAKRLEPKRNAVATYSSEDTKTSATLSSFNVDGFGRAEDFTDWFGFGYQDNTNASLNIANYVTYNAANRSVTLNNSTGRGLDFRFHPDGKIGSSNYYGKTGLGNFEIKMTLKGVDVGSSENVYIASRDTWDSTSADYYNIRVGLTGGSDTKYNFGVAGDGISYVSGGSFANLSSTSAMTVTVGYVNNYAYFYYGDYASNGYSVIKSTAVEANTINSVRDGNQTLALFLTGSSSYATSIEIFDFSYRRLDEAFDLSATDETTLGIIDKQLELETTAVATYSGNTETSATLSTFNVGYFGSALDFTNWFAFGHQDAANAGLSLSDYVKYNSTNKSVTISNTTKRGLDLRFHPDGAIGSNGYYGKTLLGNYEIKMTVRGVNVGADENVYFGSRITWESSATEYSNLSVALTGTSAGTYTFGSKAGSYVEGAKTDGLSSANGLTITVGFVNNYAYFYYGNHLSNGYSVIKTTSASLNGDSNRDGNQIFGLYLTGASTYATEIEILDFSYERLDSEFDLSATDDTTKALIADRLTVKGNSYADYMDFDFTNADKAESNQAFLDGLTVGTDTYSVAGTQYKHELTADGFVMENTTSNSHGLSYLSLGTHQYENSAIQLSVNVEENSVFELYVRTAANASRFASDGYHLIIERNNGYAYLKLESRKGSYASLGTVTLSGGAVDLMLKTEKVVNGTVAHTKFTVYTSGIAPVISTTDESLAAANTCAASLGNIAFGVRNQGSNIGKVTIKKMAIHANPNNAYWPRKDYNGLQCVEKVDDMSYEFGSADTNNAQAQAFMDKLSVCKISSAAEGTMGLTDKGYVEFKHNQTSRYARTQYEFGAYNLTNYTVMIDVEVLAGSFVLAVRVPTFQDFTSGNTVYLQFSNNGSGDGLLLSMINRTNGAYGAYFTSYSVKSNAICLRLVVEKNKISILVDEQDVLYNCYYGSSKDWASGATNYDTTVSQSGGDFVMGVMNDTTTDRARTIIKRFAFYNGATPQENVTHNYGTSVPSGALEQATKNMTFLGGFYVPYSVSIALTQQYVGKKEFSVGETITVNVADYFNANIVSNYISGTIPFAELSLKDMTYKGTVANGVWQYTFTGEDEGKSQAFALQVNHSKAGAPIVLAFRVNVVCVDSDFDHVCDSCGEPFGEHKAVDGTHSCGHCGRVVTACVDVDKNHLCDVCATQMHEHTAADSSHMCEYCKKVISECLDENGDALCDVCDAPVALENGSVCPLCGKEKSASGLCLNRDCVEQSNSAQPETENNAGGESGSQESGGCKASASGLAVVGVALMASAMMKRRRKGEEK